MSDHFSVRGRCCVSSHASADDTEALHRLLSAPVPPKLFGTGTGTGIGTGTDIGMGGGGGVVGMRAWTLRHWGTAAVVAVIAAIAIGVPTGVVASPFYMRMTPVLWWNYPVWAASSVLMGLLSATYVGVARAQGPVKPRTARALAAGALSAFAVGCPVCNKLVVLALGMSGALSYWAPAQPALAVASLALLTHALIQRLRTASACTVQRAPLPAPADNDHEPSPQSESSPSRTAP